MRNDMIFSQASLQEFLECKRRFYLRYILKLDWPAHRVEPPEGWEAKSSLGRVFHRLVHQHQIGIPPETLSGLAGEADLRDWWQSYLDHPVEGLSQVRHPEIVLSAPMGNSRLLAKYDLVSIHAGGQAIIVDWKTSKARSNRGLTTRMQTRVYRYLLVRAGASLNSGQPIEPVKVEMVYWFAEDPARPARLKYDANQYQEDEEFISDLIGRIEGLPVEGFELTDDLSRCRFCPYRSLCDRGERPGRLQDYEGELEATELGELELDLEQIAEIEF